MYDATFTVTVTTYEPLDDDARAAITGAMGGGAYETVAALGYVDPLVAVTQDRVVDSAADGGEG